MSQPENEASLLPNNGENGEKVTGSSEGSSKGSSESSSPIFQPCNETSVEPGADDGDDESGLSELVTSDGENLLAFIDEIRKIDGLGHIKLDLPQVRF